MRSRSMFAISRGGSVRSERARLLAISEPIELVLSDVLCEPGAPTRHACCPTDGFISLVTAISGHPGVEAGMVGSEGMVGCIEKTHEQARA